MIFRKASDALDSDGRGFDFKYACPATIARRSVRPSRVHLPISFLETALPIFQHSRSTVDASTVAKFMVPLFQ